MAAAAPPPTLGRSHLSSSVCKPPVLFSVRRLLAGPLTSVLGAGREARHLAVIVLGPLRVYDNRNVTTASMISGQKSSR